MTVITVVVLRLRLPKFEWPVRETEELKWTEREREMITLNDLKSQSHALLFVVKMSFLCSIMVNFFMVNAVHFLQHETHVFGVTEYSLL